MNAEAAEAYEPGWAFDVPAMIEFVRSSDFPISPGETLRATALLQRLFEERRSPASAAEAATWLAPILCTSARHQEVLSDRLKRFEELGERRADVPSPRIAYPDFEDDDLIDAPHTRNTLFIGLGILLVLILVAAWLAIGQGGQTIMEVSQQVDGRSTGLNWLPFVGVLLGIPPAFLVLGRRAAPKAVPVLNRGAFDGRAATDVATAGMARTLFAGDALTRAFQGFHVHRRLESDQVDVHASVRATVAACGQPRLVRGTRPILPAYPIVIEAVASRDHMIEIGRQLAERLRREAIDHMLFFSGVDPRWLRDEADRTTTLADEAARFREDVLILLGDGASLLDPAGGHVRPELGLEAWRQVVVLTPVLRARWSWRERRLAESGLLLFPVTPDGIAALGDHLSSEAQVANRARSQTAVAPGPLARLPRNSPSFHAEVEPDAADIEALVDGIALELPAGGFELVCALAAYPELRADLTHFVAASLTGSGDGSLVGPAALVAASNLPWFRLGRMPDWLRRALVLQLDPARAEEVRAIFARWIAAGDASGGTIAITAENLGEIAVASARADPAGSFGDAVFLRFCNREDLQSLDLDAPDNLVEAIKAGEQRRSRWQIGIAGAMSLALAGTWMLLDLLAAPFPFDSTSYLRAAIHLTVALVIGVSFDGLRRIYGAAPRRVVVPRSALLVNRLLLAGTGSLLLLFALNAEIRTMPLWCATLVAAPFGAYLLAIGLFVGAPFGVPVGARSSGSQVGRWTMLGLAAALMVVALLPVGLLVKLTLIPLPAYVLLRPHCPGRWGMGLVSVYFGLLVPVVAIFVLIIPRFFLGMDAPAESLITHVIDFATMGPLFGGVIGASICADRDFRLAFWTSMSLLGVQLGLVVVGSFSTVPDAPLHFASAITTLAGWTAVANSLTMLDREREQALAARLVQPLSVCLVGGGVFAVTSLFATTATSPTWAGVGAGILLQFWIYSRNRPIVKRNAGSNSALRRINRKPNQKITDIVIRLCDIIICTVSLFFLLPFIITICLAIYVLDPGPALFGHRRIGLHGKKFSVLKFRTMVVDAESRLQILLENDAAARLEWAVDHKLRMDPRISPVGRFLRRASLDELPQFFNVLRGDMSLVGPRPMTNAEAVRYGRYVQEYCSVKPGITGLWQISGRNSVSYRRRMATDILFTRHRSIGLYFRILMITPWAIISPGLRGGY